MNSISRPFKSFFQLISAFLLIIFCSIIVKAKSSNEIIDRHTDDIINYPNTASIISAAK